MFKSSATLFILALFVTLALHRQTPSATKAQQPQQPQQQSQPQVQPPAQPAQQALPVLREYRGIKLGMNREQVKAAMDKTSHTGKDWDEFKLGNDDLMTVRYDDQGAVKTIQLFFTDASRAPAWKEAIGSAEVQQQSNGSKVARAVIKDENFWVTMFQSSSGAVTTITISR
ncbi:MAG: hypothetical protein ABIP14_04860 [Blastocatellia bacterium]